MPIITLPDGTERSFDQAVSVFEVAKSIGSGLAKATLAGKVNGELVDAAFVIEANSTLSIVTDKDAEGLEVIRHSTAHLLAQATQMLYPDAQVTIGPVIKEGFYYDFAYKDGFSEDDLAKIEKNMNKLVKQNLKIERSEMSRDEAVQFFKDKGEHYKAEIIESIPAEQTLSLYKQGDFIDLCRGPHVPSTAKLKAFKLMKLAGAYWRGDSNNEMLQRVYGTAWASKQDLETHLHRLEEAEKRDHRKIGKTQDLFHMQEEAPGMVFWHEKGWALYQIVEQYMRGIFKDNDYKEVHTPQLIDKSLWEKSGHWDKFGDAMFTTSSENRDYAVKPMNCPAHIQIYNQGLKSYRDLPLRLAEFGSCHRNEPSGTLHGIMRVRNFVQDDGHIFCSEAQIQSEVSTFIDLTFSVYQHFGFENIDIKLSTRPEKRVGSDEVWDKAEAALAQALNDKGIEWELQEGEGAFYGPKIEFVLKDCLDREWQCGTLQVDFSMPERLDAQFIAEDGSKQTPVMLHRAIVGSLERFVGILIEHYEGAFPSWLAPIQAVILNISEKQADFSIDVEKKLKKQGIRVISDLRNEKIGFKIREHSMQRFPYLLVVGDREMENGEISVRKRGGEDLGSMSIEAFIKLVKED
ncbi:Threonyl-tRNA synthetase [Bathymodiolus thermophilus thioautotrophic gill symbiont]|uniref:Threonine--tRNA ligase n=1 Tax=Bathymodiolus thermophilus thioautotrophic gill symbiont TaxID=2360 RepID=A0A1J5U9K7_9GAMM|nr:threonine--tRNA ligase [Bathymodiolus thermophilus thioautotrophic gill symbiont]AYQ56492.1 Threonine--tRNA ligase [Bathymodiolus thermophilus thioautotrophic gill symbiont]OIR25065.1 threonine--tRNA ligase [Bathymodiolus thermophilus thioautotrophic gill symbiont]CAB5500960.1 Threonyl-tRNA synthetase (EC [Bathymodiolus thermophilus thioautotrophic gill symbiont]CAB5502751.1 Threonyl-tRNA synthetase (EC [Bathymodiolus thermophilus thioautotrophic gill symbiont]SGZ59209.1 Threonyl-tRNA synth